MFEIYVEMLRKLFERQPGVIINILIKVKTIISRFFLFLGKDCVTESESFRMVCLAKPVLRTALCALNNLRGDKLEIKNE